MNAMGQAGQPAQTTAARVLLADDHQIVREILAVVLNDEPGIEIVGMAGDGLAAVDLARKVHPDVVVMDVTMPGLNGIEATRRITAENPHTRVIGLSMHEQQDMAAAMLGAGAAAYLTKGDSAGVLIEAIHALCDE